MPYYEVKQLIEDRYRVLEVLGGPGKSGQGIVYVCADEGNNNEILVLKTIQEKFLLCVI